MLFSCWGDCPVRRLLKVLALAALLFPLSALADTYFNSSEPGCDPVSPNPDYLMCDDFEDGSWYIENCDDADQSESDGWCGTIFSETTRLAGTATCGGAGAAGTTCTATSGVYATVDATTAVQGNMADHNLLGLTKVTEIWVRYYTKPSSDYEYGSEKMLTFNDGAAGGGGIKFGNQQWNCGGARRNPPANFYMNFPIPEDLCQVFNETQIVTENGVWFYIEVQMILNTPIDQADGEFRLWVKNCGAAGFCTGSPTLVIERTDVAYDRDATSEQIKSLWWETWSNQSSQGERFIDQIVVSKTGPIGFMLPSSPGVFLGVQ